MDDTAIKDMAAKAEAFDRLVEARRKVLQTGLTWLEGGEINIVAGLEASAAAAREFSRLAEQLCDRAIYADSSLASAFEEFWKDAHGDRPPGSVVVLKVPTEVGRGA